MNNDLIKRNLAISYAASGLIRRIDGEDWIRVSEVKQSLNDVPTVDTKELKPLVDKVVEILPELTDAIIKELPKMVSGKIKCSECSYYTNTFNGEWVRKDDLIHYIATQYIEHNELVPIWLKIGDLKGGAE